ncbi:complement factor H-related protein 1-like isoform X1 [Syngnathus scovelli]|uniref:complement factor H-related protein 1-like isoform X1 n=1 Tax=Syngnathus scovelli TaxID=161590 RepID=UPI002110A328|nr:complement factor H-like isoform X1 [Syngnathus scovelli]
MVLLGMSKKYIGCFLLIWFYGAHRCVSSSYFCRAPLLNGGYVVPQQDTYSHGTVLPYACENGLKPAVNGWWGTTTCQNGKWSPQPQCIDDKNCIPPAIAHAKFTSSLMGWYENGKVIRITCDAGYSYKDGNAIAQCVNGSWDSVPICERSIQACDEPPRIPHAVIINQGPRQDVYAPDTETLYECEDGYDLEGNQKKSIFCIGGTWSVAPPCIKQAKPTPGSATTSTGSETRPAGGGRRPSSGSESGNTGGSSGNTDSTDPQITTIDQCGTTPVVTNGEIVERDAMFLKYQCGSFYKQLGPDKVFCYANSQWSTTPTCKASFCSVDTQQYPQLKYDGVKYIQNGETVRLECVKLSHWLTDHYSVVRCNNARLKLGQCKHSFEMILSHSPSNQVYESLHWFLLYQTNCFRLFT